MTYKDIVYKATGKIYIGSWNEKKVIEYNSSMSKQADFIVDEAFTKAMADELGKREFTITMLLSPDTGKVMEVNFNFWRSGKTTQLHHAVMETKAPRETPPITTSRFADVTL